MDDVLKSIFNGINDCADSFNNQIKNAGLKDAFLTTSSGIGKTYCGALPLLRIDYFWYNDHIDAIDYNIIKQTTSDHYPLLMSFKIK